MTDIRINFNKLKFQNDRFKKMIKNYPKLAHNFLIKVAVKLEGFSKSTKVWARGTLQPYSQAKAKKLTRRTGNLMDAITSEVIFSARQQKARVFVRPTISRGFTFKTKTKKKIKRISKVPADVYGRDHEFGLNGKKKRPFLAPAVKKVMPRQLAGLRKQLLKFVNK